MGINRSPLPQNNGNLPLPFFCGNGERLIPIYALQASPMKLVFGRDAILNIKHVAEWEHIRQRKQLRINHNNMQENMRRNNHQYKVGDKILVKRKKNSKHKLEFMGPFPITQINDNGAVHFQKGIINYATNICRIKPFFD